MSTRQGRAGALNRHDASTLQSALRTGAENAFAIYGVALDWGVAKETARLGLPVSTYTHWWTTWDAHNLLHMLALRLDTHAQWEIRQYAEAIARIVRDWLPITWEAFEDYRLGAVTLSRQEVAYLRDVCATYKRASLDATGTTVGQDLRALEPTGMSQREIETFHRKFFGECP